MTKPVWIVALDFSPGTEHIAGFLRDMSTPYPKLVLVHVVSVSWPPAGLDASGAIFANISSEEINTAVEQAAQKQVTDFRDNITGKFPGMDVEIRIRMGDPTTEILAVGAEEKAALMVVGTHSRSGLEHFLLGSIAEKIVRKSPVSVLVVKPRTESRS